MRLPTGHAGPGHRHLGANPTPLPGFTGGVALNGGACCVGGKAGSTVTITQTFTAKSPAGPVTEMRLGGAGICLAAADLTSGWEPFVAQRDEAYAGISINWASYSVSVQFRDSQGNLSPIYCATISIEGSPA